MDEPFLLSVIKLSENTKEFAGGPLSDVNGDKLTAAGVALFSIYGTTEVGTITRIFDTDDSKRPESTVKTSRDWAWMQFSEKTNPRWIPQGDGTYELHLLVSSGHA